MNYLRLAMAQINPVVGDLEGNKKKILHYLRLAKDKRADFVTFPELCICGYPPEDLLLNCSFVEDNVKILHQIEESIDSSIVCVGFADKGDDGKVYNAAALLQDGKLKGTYRKIHLPNYGVFDEKRYFYPGTHCCLVELGPIVAGITICEDIWYPDVIQELSRQGAHVIVNISASPHHEGKGRLRERMIKKLAKENQVFLAYTNLVGGQDELVFDGHSLVYDEEGNLLARGKSFEEELMVIDLAVDDLIHTQQFFYEYQAEKDKTNHYPIQKLSFSFSPKEEQNPTLFWKNPHFSPLAELHGSLVLGIRDYVQKNGFHKVTIGLSGGIDSALVAVLAADALGRDNVVGVIMPSQFSSSETQGDAEHLANNLKIRCLKLPIADLYHGYVNSLKEVFEDYQPDVTEENLQARIRGNLLMALSNKFGWLVLTTGNKSETSVGYCTLYGDMAGGFAVIKDVPKTLVYHLVRHLNKKAGYDLIPQSIIDRAPSAELAPDQKDQDLLPPYPLLDKILKLYVEKDESFSQIVAAGYDQEIVKKVITMVDRNEYKRRQSPPGIKITPRAFGKDRRMPLTNQYWRNNIHSK